MRNWQFLAVAAVLFAGITSVQAAQITGEYLEARTCNVYIGPCFANGELGLAGKEAVMAWKVDKGSWNDVSLDGLGVALVLSAEGTLGYDGVFDMQAGKIRSVVLVDDKATKEQHAALVGFVKDAAKDLTKNVVTVNKVPFKLENDHLAGKGLFTGGDVAKIETREVRKSDCVCSNEIMFYLPLANVDNYSPAHSVNLSYKGKELKNTWNIHGLSNAYLATFRH